MGFKFVCAFCDEVIEADSANPLKEAAGIHLEKHRTELKDVFTVAFSGTKCQNNCGYVYPDNIQEVTDYECPACGYDNFQKFLQQYVFWRIERIEPENNCA